MRLLIRLHDFASGARKARVMEVLMLQSLIWQARGDLERALSVLDVALNIPPKGDYIRLFVDEGKPMVELLLDAASRGIHPKFVNRLLAAFGRIIIPATVQPLIEPLSNRELEILRVICLAVAQLIWLLHNGPVNQVVDSWTATAMPSDWMTYRDRWEYAHATRAILYTVGFGALTLVSS